LTYPATRGTLRHMLELLVVVFGPLVPFALLALASLRWGRETRPGFDERPVTDDRPNWYPISHRPLPRSAPPDPPRSGTPVPQPKPKAKPAPVRPARPPRPAPGAAWSVERPGSA
jgi:hypothetical protein